MVYRDKLRDGTVRLTGALPEAPEAWPVNSVYISFANTNPSTLFGGTWVSIGSGRMLIGVDSGDAAMDAAGDTGGSKTVTLVAANLPPHAHTITHDHNARMSTSTGAGGMIPRGTSTEALATNNPITNTNNPNSGNGPGTSDPVNNLPPYLAVYMWRRTA